MSYMTDYFKDKSLKEKYYLLQDAMREKGERLPKKHGDWYRAVTFDNNVLVYDTWNGSVYLYRNGATPSDTNNMYRVVYVFYDTDGRVENYSLVKPHMADFWRSHINNAQTE
jgi:hypothetical protein